VVDDTGNTLVEAVAERGADYRQVGFWKKTPAGFTNVFLVNQDYPAAGDTVRFTARILGGPSEFRYAISNGKATFVSDFTGLGYTDTTINRGLFREADNGFTVMALPGMVVAGTSIRMGYDLNQEGGLFVNEAGEAVFRVGTQHSPGEDYVSTLWVSDRVGALRPVVRRSGLKNVVVETPRGGVVFNGDQLTLRAADWQGNLTLNNALLRSEGLFVARSGSVSGTGAATAFDNFGLLRKDGGGTFTIDVPFRIQPPLTAGPAGVLVMAGTLGLTGGGSLGSIPPIVLTSGSTLELAGSFDVARRLTADGEGTVDLG
jgi:hypothetical protein